MKYADIPQLTPFGSYSINVSWDYVEDWIDHKEHSPYTIDLDPPFQRAHVWTEQQQREYVEFKLRGGRGSNQILWNCPGWMAKITGPLVLVDGKQRLEAVRKFLRNDLSIFSGHYCSDFEDRLRLSCADFIFTVNNLPDTQAVLQWYLELNSGGTPHTTAELEKVRKMLEEPPQG